MVKKYTRDELINELHRFVKENGRLPLRVEMIVQNGYISIHHYNKEFGGLINALIAAGYKPNYFRGYTKEDLILSVQNYYNTYGKIPTLKDIHCNKEYPSEQVIHDLFGTWNNLLITSGFKINKLWNKRSETDICTVCGVTSSCRWYYRDNKLLCNKCYESDRLYFHGTSNPNLGIGVGIITEHVVYEVLGDCVKCNTIDNFCAPHDLISEKYGTINVKSVAFIHSNKKSESTSWIFDCFKYKNTQISDTYILIGFNEDKTEILHVWIVPKNSNIFNVSGVHITNSKRGLKRASQYEVDPTPYNTVYQNLDIYTLPEFRNLPRDNITSTTTVPSEQTLQEV